MHFICYNVHIIVGPAAAFYWGILCSHVHVMRVLFHVVCVVFIKNEESGLVILISSLSLSCSSKHFLVGFVCKGMKTAFLYDFENGLVILTLVCHLFSSVTRGFHTRTCATHVWISLLI